MASLLASAGQAGNWQEFALWPTTDEQEASDVWGNVIVWQQFVAEYGDYDIYIADINNPGEPLVFVIGDANDQTNPAVYENIVVWQDYVVWEGTADWDIRVADINNLAEPQIFAVSDIADNNERNPAIHGNTVVWQDGDAGYFNIYGADITDLANPSEFQIAAFEYDQQSPAIYRTTVVWQDYRNNNWDIFGYNLTTQKEFQITIDVHDQTNPAISGNVVVWQDNRNGNSEIYAAVLDGPEVARCPSRIAGDVNGDCKIDFADFAIMASHWLECYLEPVEACR